MNTKQAVLKCAEMCRLKGHVTLSIEMEAFAATLPDEGESVVVAREAVGIVSVGPHDHGPFTFRETAYGADRLPTGDTPVFAAAPAAPAQEPVTIVWEASNMTSSFLFGSEELAKAFLSQFGAAIFGGVTIRPRVVMQAAKGEK